MYGLRRRRRQRQRVLLPAAFLTLLLLAILMVAIRFASPETSLTQAKSDKYARIDPPTTEGLEAPSGSGGPAARSTGGPDAVKGIYLTAFSAGSNLDAYLELIDDTELNAAVIDVKDVTGEVMYPSEVPLAREIGATRDVLPDLESLAAELEKRDVYAIARVAVFEDDILPRQRPDLAVTDSTTDDPWLNDAGQSWASAYEKEVWEYNTAIAVEAAEAGFDEIQFDYIRFPSDGPMDQIDYGDEAFPTKVDALAGFLEYARKQLAPHDVRVAADVFGLAATEPGAGVSQYVDELAPYLDVICPMAYPSHYPPGSYGYQDPNSEPYGILKETMADFEKETRKANPDLEIRPWIQDFDLGSPPYGPDEIRAQMSAIYDSGETGWLLWNAANVYTEEALEPAARKE